MVMGKVVMEDDNDVKATEADQRAMVAFGMSLRRWLDVELKREDASFPRTALVLNSVISRAIAPIILSQCSQDHVKGMRDCYLELANFCFDAHFDRLLRDREWLTATPVTTEKQ